MIDRSGHRCILRGNESLSPICIACRRIKRGYGLRSPDDELSLAASVNDDWRAGRGLLVQRFPNLLASVLIERNDASGRLCADRNDQKISLDQGRSGGVKISVGIFLLNVFRPDHVALQRIKTKKIARWSPSINSTVR